MPDPFTWRRMLPVSALCGAFAVGFLVLERMNYVRVTEAGLRDSFFPAGRGRLVQWGEVDYFMIQSVLTQRIVSAVLLSGYVHQLGALDVLWVEQKTGRAWRSYQDDIVEVLNSISSEFKARPDFKPVMIDVRALRRKLTVGLIGWVVALVAFYVGIYHFL